MQERNDMDTPKSETVRMGIILGAIIVLVLGLSIIIKDCRLKMMEFELKKIQIQSQK